MALTPKQRANLAKQGFTKKDIDDIAGATAPDDDDAKPPARRGRRERHVAILTGPDADEFLTRVFGDTDADDADTDDASDSDTDDADANDDGDKPDDAADDADDDPEPDDKPKPRKGYFS